VVNTEKHVLKIKHSRGPLRPLKEYYAKWQEIVVKSTEEKEKNTETEECLKGNKMKKHKSNKGNKMEKKHKSNVEEKSGLMSQEEIEALLEVVEEDDLQPLSNNGDKYKHKHEDKIHCHIPDKKPIFFVNNVKLKNTTANRMAEIVDSFNPNTIKKVKLILTGSTNHMCGIGLFLLVGDRGYCVSNISIRSYIVIKSTLFEKNIKVTETMSCLKIGDNMEIYESKITFKNKLVEKSTE